VKFNARLSLARSISQVGKAKASTANKQSANEPSKDARDKASVNFSPTSCLSQKSGKNIRKRAKSKTAQKLYRKPH
jgi:hypothetical protein